MVIWLCPGTAPAAYALQLFGFKTENPWFCVLSGYVIGHGFLGPFVKIQSGKILELHNPCSKTLLQYAVLAFS
jgi:hypothetical protein